MPEPVVIIAPAAGPAGPVVPQTRDPDAAALKAEADVAEETAAGPSLVRRILGIAFALLRRVAKALVNALFYLIREYPRHCLAAGASVVILGGILYSQSGSGTGRRDLTNAISGNPSPEADASKSPGGKPSGELAAAPKPAAADEPSTAAADPMKPPAPESKETKTAQNEVPPQPGLPAPNAESTQHDSPAPSALAQAAASEKPSGGVESAQAPPASNTNPAAVPLPPPASDSAKATLLTEASAPAPAGDQAAKTKAASDVPPDLWLPEAAPKPAADDTARTAKTGETAKTAMTGETAVAPAPSMQDKRHDDPKTAGGATSKPVEPSPPAGESITLPAPMPAAPIPLPLAPSDAKTGTATESIAPGSDKETEPPAVAPHADDGSARDKKPAPRGPEPASKPADSSSPPPAPAAPAPSSATEKTTGNPAGPDASSSTAPASAREDRISGISPPTEREREHSASADLVAPSTAAIEPKVDSGGSKNASRAGWIVIPNSGKVPVDPSESPVGGSGDSGSREGFEPSTAAADLRAHAARDVAFEPQPSQSGSNRPSAIDAARRESRSASGAGARAQPRAASHLERVEATEHLVERGENYWTISRQYWGSGRYYRALWKANQAKHPDIKDLRVGDVIVVPAVEDLDPDSILPASTDARSVSLAAAGGRARPIGQRARREDDPPGTAEQPFRGKSGSSSGVFDGNVDETESRTAARPKAGGRAPGRPVYRVRPYDTLRSIARDTLGTARRADEILDLNRGLIDDPSQLVVGQVLELPEDARASLRRPPNR